MPHLRRHPCLTSEGTHASLQRTSVLHLREHPCLVSEGTNASPQRVPMPNLKGHPCLISNGTHTSPQRAPMPHLNLRPTFAHLSPNCSLQDLRPTLPLKGSRRVHHQIVVGNNVCYRSGICEVKRAEGYIRVIVVGW